VITRRLVEMAFADLDTVEDWLRRFPHLTVSRTGDTLACRHDDGFTAGFAPLAPLDAAIALAFAVVGPLWPYALPTLIREVDAELKRRKNPETPGPHLGAEAEG
jgi:hypothetical protein